MSDQSSPSLISSPLFVSTVKADVVGWMHDADCGERAKMFVAACKTSPFCPGMIA